MRTPQPRLPSLAPWHRSKALPEPLDLDDAPQLAPIAVLQVALDRTARALESHHAFGGALTDAVLDTPHSPVLLLTRLLVDRSYELIEVLKAYRMAIAPATEDDREHDEPDAPGTFGPDDPF